MTGYQETLTDPSYHRQVVVMTAPHVGNTGVNDEDDESGRIWVAGYVVRDPALRPSNWRSQRSLEDELRRAGRRGHQRDRHPRPDPAPARARRHAGRHLLRASGPSCRSTELVTAVQQAPLMAGAALAAEVTHRRGVRRAGGGGASASPSPRSTSASRR